MEAKEGSQGFDFWGIYDEVIFHQVIAYTLGDGRKVKVTFLSQGSATRIVETFDAETTFSVEQQQAGWQAILENFKKYAEREA